MEVLIGLGLERYFLVIKRVTVENTPYDANAKHLVLSDAPRRSRVPAFVEGPAHAPHFQPGGLDLNPA